MNALATVLLLPLVVGSLAVAESTDEPGTGLTEIRRLYIDKFGGGETAAQLRDMVIASLQRARLFVVTENPERADAVMRGSGEDLVFTDTFQSGESIGGRIGLNAAAGRSRYERESAGLTGGVTASESTRIVERKHEAAASIRIVNRDGDVIWSTTQESQGAKFRGASADVAEKVTRQLVDDLERVRAARLTAAKLP
jgi:hypothetical protein